MRYPYPGERRKSFMEIKICGLTRPEDAALAAELGADYSGVVLYPGSPRGVGVEQAAAIFAAAGSALRVGVFVRPGIELLDEAVEKAGLNVIQLHGGESYEYINEVKERFPGCLVWAARHIADADEIESALSCPADGWCWMRRTVVRAWYATGHWRRGLRRRVR